MSNPKLFGYTGKGGRDWTDSDPYLDKEIQAIPDAEGGYNDVLPTAIPSPFARIDLVKKAFRNISLTTELCAQEKGKKVVASKEDEKLVSDALDVAELLFNYDMYSGQMQIIAWDRDQSLQTLKNSSSRKHRAYAGALSLFLAQDAKSYNFDELHRIYLIKFNHKVIGATSPVTLFIATADDTTHAHTKMSSGDVLFDKAYTPLYKRDKDFQIYMYSLFKAYPKLQKKMKDVHEYLNKNLKILEQKDATLYDEIHTLKVQEDDFVREYKELNTGAQNDVVEVLGVPLRKRNAGNVQEHIANKSDFRIHATKYSAAFLPLVLQNRFGKTDWLYTQHTWQKDIKVPFFDSESVLEKRRLPGNQLPYPYLTVSDFLEPYLIRLIYPINDDQYFDGGMEGSSEEGVQGYLLPLKPLFFSFFDTADLMDGGAQKPSITMSKVAKAVKVELKIPVHKLGEFIVFERLYYDHESAEVSKPDEKENKGIIVSHQFGLTIFPFVRTPENVHAEYRVQVIDRDIAKRKSTQLELQYYDEKKSEPLAIKAVQRRDDKKNERAGATSDYYVVQRNFDFIRLRNTEPSGASGIIIPLWHKNPPNGNKAFSFAVDFGTTNTHISYKVEGKPRDFAIGEHDVQIAPLYHPKNTDDNWGGMGAVEIGDWIDEQFVPRLLGAPPALYKLPHRTVISHSESLNLLGSTYALADFNIPFACEQRSTNRRDKIEGNLKWANKTEGNDKKIRAYFEELMMLMRAKVLLNGGQIDKTKMIWFYPTSMRPNRQAAMEREWNELFQQYFGENKKTEKLAESLAPFYYYKNEGLVKTGNSRLAVSIDIGGGTSDVVIFKGEKPELCTSFKFAANAVFGDGYAQSGNASRNALVQKYIPVYEILLRSRGNKGKKLLDILSERSAENLSEEVNSFLFSFKNNPDVKDDKELWYDRKLSADDDFRIVFLYFFVAIIYHVASLMKVQKMELPRSLFFSGTGSKTLDIVSSNDTHLAKIAQLVFEGVYNSEFSSDEELTLVREEKRPKEITCDGALVRTDNETVDVSKLQKVLSCREQDNIPQLSYKDLDDPTTISALVQYVKNFNQFFIDLHARYDFTDFFGITPEAIDIFKKEASKDLAAYLEDGIAFNQKMDAMVDGDKDKAVQETLFFYPLIGTIQHLFEVLPDTSSNA